MRCVQHRYDLIQNAAHDSNHAYVKKNKDKPKKNAALRKQNKKPKDELSIKKPEPQTNKRFLITTEDGA